MCIAPGARERGVVGGEHPRILSALETRSGLQGRSL